MNIDTLVADFAAHRWDTNPFERLFALARTNPENLEALVDVALDRAPKGGTFVDTALALVSQDAFGRLVQRVCGSLGQWSGNEVADSVVAYASLQFPGLLHPYLPEIFEHRPNAGSYYENWPWRESGETSIGFLQKKLLSPGEPAEVRLKAWQCMLYFEAQRPVWIGHSINPTWLLPRTGHACRFGGTDPGSCGLCAEPLHHILTIPGALLHGACALPSVELATCLSCLGWVRSPLFYRHSPAGRPTALDRGNETPEFPASPLKETIVHLHPTPARWRWQDWALSNSRENLHRVGGHPSWVQSAEFPACPCCQETMDFVLQLDSDLPAVDGNEWMWGSGGICYAFWCPQDNVSGFLWQCT